MCRNRHSRRIEAHAAEQDRLDAMKSHEAWFEGQLDLDAERVLLLDETATAANGAQFLSSVTDTLVPVLTPGDTVAMDNLATHTVAGVRQAIEAVGSHLRYLSTYSPDFIPIEGAFPKLKHCYGRRRPAPSKTFELPTINLPGVHATQTRRVP